MPGDRKPQRNVGGIERALRIAAGAAFLLLALVLEGAGWRLAAYSVGIAALLTALVAYCPLNAALGRDTTRNPRWKSRSC